MRDSFVDVATLAEVDLATSPDAYAEAMKHAYWEDKDLSAAMAIAWAGISRLLADAHRAEASRAYELRSRARALAYDLASFTWPGWDEPGIVITPPESRARLAAARANLAMTVELQQGDLPIARAHWMVGAHQLAAGRFDDASTSFETATTHADAAGAEGAAQAALARSFAILARLATGAATEAELAASSDQLGAAPDGVALVRQLATARAALGI